MENSRLTVAEHLEKFELKYCLLTTAQNFVVDAVLAAIDNKRPIPKCFFIDGIGDAGKTYIFETLIHCLRSRGDPIQYKYQLRQI